MKKNKYLSLIFAGILLLSGCVSPSNEDTSAEDDETTPTTENVETTDLSADVVVVGAGGAGLTTSLSAAQNGAEVILLEKMAMPGGATAMAGGGTNATGSEMQEKYTEEDSPEILFMDLMRNGNFSNHASTTWLYAESVGSAFDWLVDDNGAGVAYKDNEPQPSSENTVGRNFSADGMGSAVIQTLADKSEDEGVEILYETPAIELIEDDGVVKGVIAENSDGELYEITADSVVIASGGYGGNDDLLNDYIRSFAYAGAVSATGDGLIMAQDVGADAINLDKVNLQPNSIVLPDGRGQHTHQGSQEMFNNTGSILVSDQGERFVNEQAPAFDIREKMEENEHTYLLMDEESFNTYTEICIASKNYTEEQLDEWLGANGTMTPVFAQGSDLDELGEAIDVPGENLKETVERYNELVEQDEDTDFGRTTSDTMDTDGNFYAVEMNIRYYASLGGLRINDDMQVVRPDDSSIEGLYAAGEAVGGVLGDVYTPGALFGWAVTSGYNAGNAVTNN